MMFGLKVHNLLRRVDVCRLQLQALPMPVHETSTMQVRSSRVVLRFEVFVLSSPSLFPGV